MQRFHHHASLNRISYVIKIHFKFLLDFYPAEALAFWNSQPELARWVQGDLTLFDNGETACISLAQVYVLYRAALKPESSLVAELIFSFSNHLQQMFSQFMVDFGDGTLREMNFLELCENVEAAFTAKCDNLGLAILERNPELLALMRGEKVIIANTKWWKEISEERLVMNFLFAVNTRNDHFQQVLWHHNTRLKKYYAKSLENAADLLLNLLENPAESLILQWYIDAIIHPRVITNALQTLEETRLDIPSTHMQLLHKRLQELEGSVEKIPEDGPFLWVGLEDWSTIETLPPNEFSIPLAFSDDDSQLEISESMLSDDLLTPEITEADIHRFFRKPPDTKMQGYIVNLPCPSQLK